MMCRENGSRGSQNAEKTMKASIFLNVWDALRTFNFKRVQEKWIKRNDGELYQVFLSFTTLSPMRNTPFWKLLAYTIPKDNIFDSCFIMFTVQPWFTEQHIAQLLSSGTLVNGGAHFPSFWSVFQLWCINNIWLYCLWYWLSLFNLTHKNGKIERGFLEIFGIRKASFCKC